MVTSPTGSITSVTNPRTSLVTDDLLPAGSVDAIGLPALSHSMVRTNPLGVIVAFGTIPVTRQSYSNWVTTPKGSVMLVTMPAASTSYSVTSPSLPVIWAGSPHAPGVIVSVVPSPKSIRVMVPYSSRSMVVTTPVFEISFTIWWCSSYSRSVTTPSGVITRHTSPVGVDRYTVGRISPRNSSRSNSSDRAHDLSSLTLVRPRPVKPAPTRPFSRRRFARGSLSNRSKYSLIHVSPISVGLPWNSPAHSRATQTTPSSGASVPSSFSHTATLGNMPPDPTWAITLPLSSNR